MSAWELFLPLNGGEKNGMVWDIELLPLYHGIRTKSLGKKSKTNGFNREYAESL